MHPWQLKLLKTCGLIFPLVILGVSIASCQTTHVNERNIILQLEGTPLSFNQPKGFVARAKGEEIIIPRRPFMAFRLPLGPSGNPGALPWIEIEQLPPNEGAKTLDLYIMNHLPTDPLLSKTLLSPKKIMINGTKAIEFGSLDFVFDGPMQIYYETDFEHGGFIYQCTLIADPHNYKQYVPIYEDFCSSMRFAKKQ